MSPIPVHARRTVALLFAYAFSNAAAYIASRAVADSLFLSHIGPAQLPAMYVITALVVTFAALLHSQAAKRLHIGSLIIGTLSLWSIVYSLLPMVAERWPKSLLIFGIVIVLSEVRGALGSIHLATLLHEHSNQDESQRVVGMVGLGATLGGLVFGALVGSLSDVIETEQMLYLSAALDVVAIVLVMWLWAHRNTRVVAELGEPQPPLITPPSAYRLRDVFALPLVRGMVLIVVAAVAVSILVEYRWKYTIAAALYRDEHELTAYFGYFYAGIYLVTGLLQFFVAGRLLERSGPFPGLLSFPLGLLAAVSITISGGGTLLLATEMSATKGCDVLRRGLYDPAVQVLYARLPEAVRRQAIALVAGIAKPLSEAATSLTLLLMPPVQDDTILTMTLALILSWLVIVLRFRRVVEESQPNS